MAQIDKVRIIQRRLISDDRGWFLKVITGTEEGIPSHTGEVYLTMGKPGQERGGTIILKLWSGSLSLTVALFSN